LVLLWCYIWASKDSFQQGTRFIYLRGHYGNLEWSKVKGFKRSHRPLRILWHVWVRNISLFMWKWLPLLHLSAWQLVLISKAQS
jgi:hypothetical protein